MPSLPSYCHCSHPRFQMWDFGSSNQSVLARESQAPSSADPWNQQSHWGKAWSWCPLVAFKQLSLSRTPKRNKSFPRDSSTLGETLPMKNTAGLSFHGKQSQPISFFPSRSAFRWCKGSLPPEQQWVLPPALPRATHFYHFSCRCHGCVAAQCWRLTTSREGGRLPRQGWCSSPFWWSPCFRGVQTHCQTEHPQSREALVLLQSTTACRLGRNQLQDGLCCLCSSMNNTRQK